MTDSHSRSALASSALVTATPFPPTSRYARHAHGGRREAKGRTVVYLRRRFVPPPEHFALCRNTRGPGRAARHDRRAVPRRPRAVLAVLRRQRRDPARGADRGNRAECASRCRGMPGRTNRIKDHVAEGSPPDADDRPGRAGARAARRDRRADRVQVTHGRRKRRAASS